MLLYFGAFNTCHLSLFLTDTCYNCQINYFKKQSDELQKLHDSRKLLREIKTDTRDESDTNRKIQFVTTISEINLEYTTT